MKIILKTIALVLLIAIVLSSCTTSPVEPQSEKKLKKVVEEEPELSTIHVTKRDATIIGHKIWMNEGADKEKNLTVWNRGETFASLGIGHFIWYPAGGKGPYDEQFPDLLVFLQQQRIALPEWLQNNPDCPWNTYQEFYDDIYSAKMIKVRNLLKNTIPQQVQFIIRRLEKALPKMMAVLTTRAKRDHLREQFYRVAQIPTGIYALFDYMNFKGEGISSKERYKGKGWGLLQVLENMQGNTDDVMMEFVESADFVLTRRVNNAPKDESLWLTEWRNRLKTYVQEL